MQDHPAVDHDELTGERFAPVLVRNTAMGRGESPDGPRKNFLTVGWATPSIDEKLPVAKIIQRQNAPLPLG
jgi:hypothetical protein